MKIFYKSHHLVGGTLLIAGTSIGVGMLALPVATAAGGFIPAFALSILCWLFMVSTALLIVEACTWMPKEANFITISKNLLGKKGAAICWVLYLFLFYCLMTAHTAAGGDAFFELFGRMIPHSMTTLLYVLLFAPIIYLGTRFVDHLNTGLMAGVIVTYFLFVVVAAPHVDFSLLAHSDWSSIWSSLSVIFVMFGFQNVVPTLYNYMERDHKKLRKAIWIGSSIPLALYLIWELLILGTVPLENLSEALHEGQSAAIALQHTVEKGVISSIASFFALFAMSTSFAGISIAFFDFFADGLKWEKAGVKRFALVLLVFFIPLLFVFLNPAIFIQALRWGGGIGAILLFGILPVLDVWSGRYFHGHPLTHQFIRGGKWSLSLILVLSVLVLLSNL